MSVSQESPRTAPEPVDAIALLRSDMSQLDGEFGRYWETSHDDDLERRAGKAEVARSLLQHTRAHLALEQAFVRAIGGTVADAALLREMQTGQAKALELVTAIERIDPADRQYDPAVRVLGDFLLKHADGEREGLFRHVAASRVNLFDLGEQLRRTHGVVRPPAN